MRMQTTDSSHLLEKLRQEDHSVESLQRLGSIPSISQEGESEEVCKESWRDGSVVKSTTAAAEDPSSIPNIGSSQLAVTPAQDLITLNFSSTHTPQIIF